MEFDDTCDIFLWVDDPRTTQRVNGVLTAERFDATVHLCSDGENLRSRCERVSGAIALVEASESPERLLEQLRSVARHASVVLLTEEGAEDAEFVRRARAMGAAHVLAPSTLEDEFVPLLRRLSGPRGALVPVFSAGGASGATTLAINLAREIADQSARSVLLVDMDAHYGAVASYLGLTARYGVADVLAHGEHVDGSFLNSAAIPVDSEQIRVLVSPFTVRPTAPAPLALHHLPSALEVCRANFTYTVIDAPRLGASANAALAEAASSGLIAMQQMVKDVHVARAMFHALTEAGLPVERLQYVVNRYGKKNPFISLPELKEALGSEKLSYLSNDFSAIVEAVNLGRMLADIRPKSTLRNEIRALAARLAEEGSAVRA